MHIAEAGSSLRVQALAGSRPTGLGCTGTLGGRRNLAACGLFAQNAFSSYGTKRPRESLASLIPFSWPRCSGGWVAAAFRAPRPKRRGGVPSGSVLIAGLGDRGDT
jgi:hypothetical protein